MFRTKSWPLVYNHNRTFVEIMTKLEVRTLVQVIYDNFVMESNFDFSDFSSQVDFSVNVNPH